MKRGPRVRGDLRVDRPCRRRSPICLIPHFPSFPCVPCALAAFFSSFPRRRPNKRLVPTALRAAAEAFVGPRLGAQPRRSPGRDVLGALIRDARKRIKVGSRNLLFDDLSQYLFRSSGGRASRGWRGDVEGQPLDRGDVFRVRDVGVRPVWLCEQHRISAAETGVDHRRATRAEPHHRALASVRRGVWRGPRRTRLRVSL